MVNASNHDNVENFENWSAEDLATYLKAKCELADYYEMIVKHDITGKVAPTLSENDLKEMGISSIGDRKRLQLAIQELKKAARKKEREKEEQSAGVVRARGLSLRTVSGYEQ